QPLGKEWIATEAPGTRTTHYTRVAPVVKRGAPLRFRSRPGTRSAQKLQSLGASAGRGRRYTRARPTLYRCYSAEDLWTFAVFSWQERSSVRGQQRHWRPAADRILGPSRMPSGDP